MQVQPAGRWSALHQAAAAGVRSEVEWLLAKGASKDVTTRDGEKPADVATDFSIIVMLQD